MEIKVLGEELLKQIFVTSTKEEAMASNREEKV